MLPILGPHGQGEMELIEMLSVGDDSAPREPDHGLRIESAACSLFGIRALIDFVPNERSASNFCLTRWFHSRAMNPQ
jgi:hypothetical protein